MILVMVMLGDVVWSDVRGRPRRRASNGRLAGLELGLAPISARQARSCKHDGLSLAPPPP